MKLIVPNGWKNRTRNSRGSTTRTTSKLCGLIWILMDLIMDKYYNRRCEHHLIRRAVSVWHPDRPQDYLKPLELDKNCSQEHFWLCLVLNSSSSCSVFSSPYHLCNIWLTRRTAKAINFTRKYVSTVYVTSLLSPLITYCILGVFHTPYHAAILSSSACFYIRYVSANAWHGNMGNKSSAKWCVPVLLDWSRPPS